MRVRVRIRASATARVRTRVRVRVYNSVHMARTRSVERRMGVDAT